MRQALVGLAATQTFLKAYNDSANEAVLDAACLQLRKSLEAIAFSAIAAHRLEYEKFRKSAKASPDFRRDYHARKIIEAMKRINKDFYPLPLLPGTIDSSGQKHFPQKSAGYLTQQRFIRIYDRLAARLHSKNPWLKNSDKGLTPVELHSALDETTSLLDIHAATIRTPTFEGVFLVIARDPTDVQVALAQANGPFTVDRLTSIKRR